MLSGVLFQRTASESDAREDPLPLFTNQYILTDLSISSFLSPALKSPILPSIATLINPASSILTILFRIIRAVVIVFLSHLPISPQKIKRISVANTAIYFHDGRALATCESGPPMRIQLPGLKTVGWYNGNKAEGEPSSPDDDVARSGFGGKGLLSFMKEWTTGHPKIDPRTGELIAFHCNFAPPYVHCSVVPPKNCRSHSLFNMPVPGVSGGKMMHDFGVSLGHTVILDLPLTLSGMNLLKGLPTVTYEPDRPARFGVFPRYNPRDISWFETDGCCIFHTANTWDEYDLEGRPTAVNMLACRLTSASVVYGPGNMLPPRRIRKETYKRRPWSPLAQRMGKKASEDVERTYTDEKTPILLKSDATSSLDDGEEEYEECRLYYYQFSLNHTAPTITRQYALSIIPIEFPTLNPAYEMSFARYIYGCSTTADTFGAALGKASKIDVLVKMDVETLLARGKQYPPANITGSVDTRTLPEVIVTPQEEDSSIKAFLLPANLYAQEARFVSRANPASEDDGYLLFYVFDESQLDQEGECPPDCVSELWILDAKTMDDVVARIFLPQRVPYGLHGNWFSKEQLQSQRAVEQFRTLPEAPEGLGAAIMDRLLGILR